MDDEEEERKGQNHFSNLGRVIIVWVHQTRWGMGGSWNLAARTLLTRARRQMSALSLGKHRDRDV